MKTRTRNLLILAVWIAVAILLLVWPALLWFHSPKAFAQDLGGHELEISAAEDMLNPRTGEEGTWIPRWVEREHVLDQQKLVTCVKDGMFADAALLAMADKTTSLEAELHDLESARDHMFAELISADQTQEASAKKLDRRLRAVWGVSIAAAAAVLAATVAILR